MVDPRTPVVVGVGQFTERIGDPDYRGMSAVDLATEAVRAALADTGADVADVARAIEVFAGLRQFEICTPFSEPPLGASDNYVRSVAQRVGADPGARAHRWERFAEGGLGVRQSDR
jgi:acetyl-CoA C-acetyltransferase